MQLVTELVYSMPPSLLLDLPPPSVQTYFMDECLQYLSHHLLKVVTFVSQCCIAAHSHIASGSVMD